MRRRITFAILATVAAALLSVGLGTVLLDRLSARAGAERELQNQAEGLVDLFAPTVAGGGQPLRAVTNRLVRSFDLEGIDFVFIGGGGRVVGTLPEGVPGSWLDRDLERLRAGDTLSGRQGRLVYALAPASTPRGTLVAVVTRQVDTTPAAFRWLVVSAAGAMVLGVAVALWLSRALTEPLRRAEAATHRIAGGDLSTRLIEPPPTADDELSDLARSINTMAEGLERSRGLERQFLLSVSHDLRTPLTSIRGYAEALTDGTATDVRSAAGIILSESRRLDRLVGDLLELARLDARQFSLDLRILPVTDVVAEAAAGFAREARDAGIALVVVDDPQRAVASVDPDRLGQVVANLVGNGLRYASSRITVATTAVDGSVVVTVSDDGPGIAADDLPHVFERLYVAGHRPGGGESGSGLGLAIVRELIGAMSGTVVAESPAGESGPGGTRMVVRLPRVLGGG